jgi:phosphate transport system ATP-binding protein
LTTTGNGRRALLLCDRACVGGPFGSQLCVARLLPLKPEVILMDKPCSALDVEATRGIEELMFELKGRYTIVVVAHNMARARRASDECIFMLPGKVIEHARTTDLFVSPRDERAAACIEGRYA